MLISANSLFKVNGFLVSAIAEAGPNINKQNSAIQNTLGIALS
jgi:hypothetical protein